MQGATLYTGLLHRGTLRQCVLNHSNFWNGLSSVVSSLYSIMGLSGIISCSVPLSRPIFSITELSGTVF